MNFINISLAWILTAILLTSCAPAPTMVAVDKSVTNDKDVVNSPIAEAIAQFDKGRNYYSSKEYKKSYDLWLLAADAKILEAYNNLGYLTYYGLGVKADLNLGLRLWEIAADNGNAESQIHISEAYEEGISLPKDLIEAYAWAKTAAYFVSYVGEDHIRKDLEHDSKALIQKYARKLSRTALKRAEARANSLIVRISEIVKTTPYIQRFSFQTDF